MITSSIGQAASQPLHAVKTRLSRVYCKEVAIRLSSDFVGSQKRQAIKKGTWRRGRRGRRRRRRRRWRRGRFGRWTWKRAMLRSAQEQEIVWSIEMRMVHSIYKSYTLAAVPYQCYMCTTVIMVKLLHLLGGGDGGGGGGRGGGRGGGEGGGLGGGGGGVGVVAVEAG